MPANPISPNKCTIRHAYDADVNTVTACVKAAFSLYIERIGRPPGPMLADYASLIRAQKVWVAEVDNNITGAIVLDITPEGFLLDTIAVEPSFQGTGVGRALLQFAEQQAKENGFDSIYLFTHATMTENQVLYPKIGYVRYDRRITEGYDRIFYRKQLK